MNEEGVKRTIVPVFKKSATARGCAARSYISRGEKREKRGTGSRREIEAALLQRRQIIVKTISP